MGALLPNLPDLIAALPVADAAADARVLAEAAADAESAEQLDQMLHEVIDAWLEH